MYFLFVILDLYELRVSLTFDDTPRLSVSNRKHLKVVTILLTSIVVKTILFLGLIIRATIR